MACRYVKYLWFHCRYRQGLRTVSSQNGPNEHGVPTYLKGVLQTKPRLEVAKATMAKVLELTEDRTDIEIALMFENFPLGKNNSLPNDATACQRVAYSNVLNVIRWKENTPEALKLAQEISRQVTGIVTDANEELSDSEKVNGYGNYGAFLGRSISDIPSPALLSSLSRSSN